MSLLEGQTILIGKEPGRGRLQIAVNGKSAYLGADWSVPACVSRCVPAEGVAHAILKIE